VGTRRPYPVGSGHFREYFIKIGAKNAFVTKFVESIMVKIIFISFIPSIAGVFVILIHYLLGQPFELTLENSIQIGA
jgi:hypothetical protein